MSRRKVILILLAIAIGLIVALVEVNATYEVLNQGERPACMIYAVETYIDVVGEPSDIGVDKAYKDLGKGAVDAKTVLDHYVTNGAIIAYEEIEEVTEYPVIILTWMDAKDWRDGDITVPRKRFVNRHATVLIGEKDGYYIGVNSWGARWGYAGHYRLYDTYIISRIYRLTLPDAEIWR